MSDETTQMLVLNLQATNNDQNDSTPTSSSIFQLSTPIVSSMKDWNLYFKSIYITTAEVPYCNMLRNLSFDDLAFTLNGVNPKYANFACNRTNLSVQLTAVAGSYPFRSTDGLAPANPTLMFFFNEDPANAGHYNGVGSYLQFTSENANPVQYPTPPANQANPPAITSIGYPKTYFNVHSIEQFLDFINIAIQRCASTDSSGIIAGATPYQFYYDQSTGLYGCYVASVAVSNANPPVTAFYLSVNTYLERFLDLFRWSWTGQNSDVSIPPNSMVVGGTYTGVDYIFTPTTTFNNVWYSIVGDPVGWNILSEDTCVPNLVDIHSLIISVGGDLGSVVQQVIPGATTSNSLLLPSKKVIKILDVSTQFAQGVNNCIFQATADVLDMPINMPYNGPLQNIQFTFEVMTIDNQIYPIEIPAGLGFAGVRIALKKRDRPI